MALGAAGRRELESGDGSEEITDEAVRAALRRRARWMQGWALVGAILVTAIACWMPY